MKIGIITIHNSPNYGACLQAFALWKYLEMQGHDVEIIDLYRPYQREYVPSRKYKPYAKSMSCKSILSSLLRKTKIRNKSQQTFSEEAFQKFHTFNSMIRMSKPYKGIDELYANPPQYDLYISGSDQLWNPTQPYCLEPYFLTFAPRESKKISFATSIGVTYLTENVKRDFKKWLSSYDAISVREKQGKDLLESFLDREVYQVADPTFLLEPQIWESLAVFPSAEKPYVLLFALQHNQELFDYAQKIAKECDKQLLYLCQVVEFGAFENCTIINNAGIEEFIGYVANADLLITESFHGTVFSLLMGTKNFYAYISQKNNRGSRIEDLLSPFGLSDHILRGQLDLSYADLLKMQIDIHKKNSTIEQLRNNATAFINRYI